VVSRPNPFNRTKTPKADGTLGELRRATSRSAAGPPAGHDFAAAQRPVTMACNYQSIDAFCPLAIKPFHDLPLKSGGVSNMKNILDLLCDARGEPSWQG
jgi:hypothetical protein